MNKQNRNKHRYREKYWYSPDEKDVGGITIKVKSYYKVQIALMPVPDSFDYSGLVI